MATLHMVWDRKERRFVGGPFPSSAIATEYSRRVLSKNPEVPGQGGKLLDNVSVTVP